MNIRARAATPVLVSFLALFYGCTQDFDQFTPFGITASSSSGSDATSSSSGSSSSSSGMGGSSSSSTSSSSSSGVGGAGVGGAGGALVGAGGAGGGLGGMGGMGGSPLENCLDGIDNDGDMATDCMDAECGAFECTAPAPAGWEGYFRINISKYPNATPANCPDGSAPSTFFDTPSAASCEACTCGAWAGASCAPPAITCYDGSTNCGGNQFLNLAGLTANGACFAVPNIPGMPAMRSCRLTALASVADNGACPPSGGALIPPADLWVNQDDVCGQQIAGGAGCAGGQACVPMGGGTYNGPVCIRKMGQDVCPAGYPTMITAATGADDTRTCSACACGVNGVTCTGGGYTVHDNDNCSGGNQNVNTMTCVNVSNELDNDTGGINGTTPTPANGTCAPNGGQLMGAVTPQGVVTYCCK